MSFFVSISLKNRINIKNALQIILILATGIYCITIVLNTRDLIGTTSELKFSILKPFSNTQRSTLNTIEELSDRLDGLHAMALMKNNIDKQGPALGSTWINFLIHAVSQPFVRIFNNDTIDLISSNKTELLKEYASIDVADFESCCLTDVYGNFNYYAFPVVSFFLAYVFAFSIQCSTSKNIFKCTIGYFILYYIFQFEREFALIFYGWLKIALFIFPFYMIVFIKSNNTLKNK
jgi:hypothetical protein